MSGGSFDDGTSGGGGGGLRAGDDHSLSGSNGEDHSYIGMGSSVDDSRIEPGARARVGPVVPPLDLAPPAPLRAFVSCVDSYSGSRIAEALSSALVPPVENPYVTGSVSGDRSGFNSGDISGRPRGGGGGGGGGGVGTGEYSDRSLPIPRDRKVEVIGTLSTPGGKVPAFVTDVVPSGDNDALYAAVETCDIVVYDIVTDVEQAKWLVETMQAKADEEWETPKIFICLSTVMTWGRTRKLEASDEYDMGEEPLGFLEDEFRRRKPHSNFKAHNRVEKIAIRRKNRRKKLLPWVVTAGLLYGEEEDLFHYLFKAAWHGAPKKLPCVRGDNTLPTLHVRDLASIIRQVVIERPQPQYILAVDESMHVSEDIVRSVSRALGTGHVHKLTKDEMLLFREVSAQELDMLSVDVTLSSDIVRTFDMDWVAPEGMIVHLPQIITEYRNARGLTPIKIFIQGPPASGKSAVAAAVAAEYKLHHIQIKEVIDGYMDALRARIDGPEGEGEYDDGRELDIERYENIMAQAEENGGIYPDEYVADMVREKLLSHPCQNQGFVLDGWPKTSNQAIELFRPLEDGDDTVASTEAGDALDARSDMRILPEFVFVLEADDAFLRDRVMALPEHEVAGTHYNETDLNRRLRVYRHNNNDDDASWFYFDQHEIIPTELNAADTVPVLLNKVKFVVGDAHNYGPTPEEIADRERRMRIEATRKAEEERRIAAEREAAEAAERAAAEAAWEARLASIRRDEEVLLEQRSVPLRGYLLQNVIPVLTEGLMEVCKVRPDDPIDYLAEFLFSHNDVEDHTTL